jgi:hypothetical protein
MPVKAEGKIRPFGLTKPAARNAWAWAGCDSQWRTRGGVPLLPSCPALQLSRELTDLSFRQLSASPMMSFRARGVGPSARGGGEESPRGSKNAGALAGGASAGVPDGPGRPPPAGRRRVRLLTRERWVAEAQVGRIGGDGHAPAVCFSPACAGVVRASPDDRSPHFVASLASPLRVLR